MLLPIPRVLFISVAIVALAAFTGCQRGEPMDQKVDASTALAFGQWKNNQLEHLTPDQAEGFTNAMDELKLKAMAQGASGDAIDAQVRQEVNGKTVREAMQLGLSWKLARLEEQRGLYDAFLKKNAELKTNPGDSASADYLADRRDQQAAQRDAADRQIAQLKRQMQDLGLAVQPAKIDSKALQSVQNAGAENPAPAPAH